MQNLMRFMTAWLAKEFLINLLNVRALMGLSKRSVLISAIKRFRSLCTNIGKVAYVSRYDNLTAAVYTSAGQSHYLNKGNIQLAALDFIKQCGGVSKSGSYRNGNLLSANVVSGSLNPFNSGYFLEYEAPLP